jgi:hypothetical protein
MWDAWGGDAGFSWSRKIAEREKDKALFLMSLLLLPFAKTERVRQKVWLLWVTTPNKCWVVRLETLRPFAR